MATCHSITLKCLWHIRKSSASFAIAMEFEQEVSYSLSFCQLFGMGLFVKLTHSSASLSLTSSGAGRSKKLAKQAAAKFIYRYVVTYLDEEIFECLRF